MIKNTHGGKSQTIGNEMTFIELTKALGCSAVVAAFLIKETGIKGTLQNGTRLWSLDEIEAIRNSREYGA